MAKYIMIAGKANYRMGDLFKANSDIEVLSTFNSPKQLADTILTTGVSFLQEVEAILLLDYGFENTDYLARTKEFIYLQDALKVHQLANTGVKLYLATRDSDVYREIKNQDSGMPCILYLYVEVFILEKYANKILVDILKGARHKRGLYNPEIDKLNIDSRIQEQTERFVEESKAYNRNIINVGKEEELSEFAKEEYVDSAVSANIIEQEKAKARKEKKLKELEEKKRKKSTLKQDTSINDIESKKVIVNFERRGNKQFPNEIEEKVNINNRQSTRNQTTPNNKIPTAIKTVDKTELPDILKIKKIFDDLAFQTGGAVRGKLESDNGVLCFSSYLNGGASSLLANLADIFALSNKKVLIIDLDIYKKTQTSAYFKNYDMEVKNHFGVSDGLIKVVEGGSLSRNVVEISSRISVLGLSPSIQADSNWIKEIQENLEFVIDDARSLYDIVLIDIPSDLVYDIYPNLVDSIDKNIFVIDNKYYTISQFVNTFLLKFQQKNPNEFENLFLKSEVIINKFNRKNIDTKGKESGKVQLREELNKRNYPYDKIHVTGELPLFDNWDTQFVEGLRYVWLNEKAMGMYRYIFSRVVW